MARTQPRMPARMNSLAAVLDPEIGGPMGRDMRTLSLSGLNELPPRFDDPMYLPIDNRGPGRSFDPEYGPSDRLDYWSPREMQMPLPVGREQSFPDEAMRGGQSTDSLMGGTKSSYGSGYKQVATKAEIAGYIRQQAAIRGMDPDYAVRVYQGEGVNGYVGDRGKSFGPYQLYTGGGVGNRFIRDTGLDLRDPNTWREQVQYALNVAAEEGWGAWNGRPGGRGSPTRVGLANARPVPLVVGDTSVPDTRGIADVAARTTGNSVTPAQPTASQGFAPSIPASASFPTPQVAQEMTPDQIDQLTMVDAAGNYLNPPSQAPLPAMPPTWASGSFPEAGGQGQDTMAGGTFPPMPRLRDQSVLDQQRADMLDEMLFGAGPHRGEYARGRPEGRFMGGGAPDASTVPMPTLSPLNPAVGGPADRRPQPPMPTLRPDGRWMSGAGGAPDAATVPNPPPRGTPYAPGFPDVFGEQPAPLAGGMPAEIGNAPVTPPRATRETWNSMGLGSRGNAETQMSLDRDWSQPLTSAPPTPPNPYDDWTRQYDTPGPITQANERMGVFEGTPDPSTIAPPPNTPEVGNVNYPGPLPTQRLPQTQAAVSEPGMGLGPYGMTPPPPETGPFFDNANPGPTFTPPAPAGTSFNIPPSPFEGSTGEFFTPAPPMPMPQPSMMADRFSDAFSPGGGGQIMDLQSAFDRRNAPPTMNAQGGINSVFGAPPAQATVPNLAIPFAEVPRPNFDFAGPAPAAAANLTSPLPIPTISQQDFDARFAGGTVAPTAPTPGVTPGVVSGTMPEPGAMDSPPPPVAAAPAPLPAPAPAPTQAAAAPKGGGAGGFIGRALGGLLGGPLGAMGGGLLGGGGGFGFGGSAAFTPIMGSGGTAPSTGSNGQTFNTTYRHGNSGNMQGTMWNRSTGGSVGYVTDPFTGAMIYSSSPMTF